MRWIYEKKYDDLESWVFDHITATIIINHEITNNKFQLLINGFDDSTTILKSKNIDDAKKEAIKIVSRKAFKIVDRLSKLMVDVLEINNE